MQSLEDAEQLVRVGHVESGSIVAHEKHINARPVQTADLNRRLGHAAGELPGVAHQVLERCAQQPLVSARHHSVRNAERDVPVRIRFCQVRGDGPGQRSDVNRPPDHLRTSQSRQVEQVVDQLRHALARSAYAIQ